jgi:hypothetical protein
MKAKIIVAFLLVAISGVSSAQSLDIGGVELRLGQDIGEAIKSLSMYEVRYLETAGLWHVRQVGTPLSSSIGFITASNNKIMWVSKTYSVSQNSNLSLVYSSASNELNRRGGKTCVWQESGIEENDVTGYVQRFSKKCGPYELVFYLPSKIPDGDVTSAGIQLTLTGK